MTLKSDEYRMKVTRDAELFHYGVTLNHKLSLMAMTGYCLAEIAH